jgi:hypothetical protein
MFFREPATFLRKGDSLASLVVFRFAQRYDVPFFKFFERRIIGLFAD